ncbi:hypothetical protein NFJ02_16g25230 [Pycnococcus provasolii]
MSTSHSLGGGMHGGGEDGGGGEGGGSLDSLLNPRTPMDTDIGPPEKGPGAADSSPAAPRPPVLDNLAGGGAGGGGAAPNTQNNNNNTSTDTDEPEITEDEDTPREEDNNKSKSGGGSEHERNSLLVPKSEEDSERDARNGREAGMSPSGDDVEMTTPSSQQLPPPPPRATAAPSAGKNNASKSGKEKNKDKAPASRAAGGALRPHEMAPRALPLRPDAAARVFSAGMLSGDYGRQDATMLHALEHLTPDQLRNKAAELDQRHHKLRMEEASETRRAHELMTWCLLPSEHSPATPSEETRTPEG